MRFLRFVSGIIGNNMASHLPLGVFLLLLFCAHAVQSQDTHHWGNQFGTKAALLGGAVLTDTTDNAGVYYNPGNLAYLDTSSLTINANTYGIENVKIVNALGQRADFKGLQFNTIPLLVSGSIQTNSKWNISYGLMTPVSFSFNGIARLNGFFDLATGEISPGEEELVAESGINTKVQETMVAIGAGRKIGENLGFGISLLNTLRTVNYSFRFSAKALTNTEDYLMIARIQNEFIDYFAVRTALKAGLNYQKAGYGLGLTVTSPGLDWLGSGTVAEDLTLSNIAVPNSEDRFTAYASDRQEKLKTTYKSPLELALGGHKNFNRSTLSLNVTFFSGVDQYAIIQPESVALVRPNDIGPLIDSEDFLKVESSMKPVTNFALGYSKELRENLSIMGSFRTDFSYFDKESLENTGLQTELTQWDIYHFTIGTEIKKSRSSLSLGLVYSFGSTSEYLQRGSFYNIDSDQLLEGALVVTEAGYSNFGILIGYAFNFKKFN
ncbi:hypothetical protein [Algoriphagus halophytocola]|uniref:Aromatic hydrocarbon degradation protein n=1 Tax=Algoriphagus halophytocola TaxID=2991499 RepID=A0ABY6ML56_9BACT|nr:hypothetical protein [Algoriphagus sp. TR-M5]UZD23006.1 hypothetical protein OM944_00630 [Algoriphagus sp. TR-M5]